VPRPHLVRLPKEPEVHAHDDEHCRRSDPEAVPPRYRPVLRETAITHAVPFDPASLPRSARAALDQAPADARPQLTLSSQRNGVDLQWEPRPDLMRSDSTRPHFVAEVETDQRVYVRFGDGEHGLRPAVGEHFEASYRVGTGPEGNVGAGALAHVIFPDAAVLSVTNPLPARGGVEMETIDEVCNAAPAALRRQDRAVTLDDYALEAGTHPDVQMAAATLRWTGSWHTMYLSTDRRRGLPVSQAFENELRRFLERKRLAGHDLEIEPPRFVPLELAMAVTVHPDYSQSHVRGALQDLFGRRGLFNPDNFTFGQTVFLSPLYAAAQSVAGVSSVEITTFQRQDAPGRDGLDTGKLAMGRLEIARLDNDPNFPGRGSATIDVRGGR
jgi:predicted phage baseplate assembly protein